MVLPFHYLRGKRLVLLKWKKNLWMAVLLNGLNLHAQGTLEVMEPAETSGNPIIRHIRSADPAAEVWNDGRVWIYASHDQEDATDYSNMDGYHVFSSSDLVNWTDHGEILHSRDVGWGNPGGGWMFAPDAAYKNGTYYLYFPHLSSEWRWRIGVATSDRPEGPFTDVGHYIEGTDNIDPTCFVDDDGQAYLLWGGGDVGTSVPKIARLSENMTELAEEPRIIDYGAENFGEGGYLHKRDSLYYFSYTCHSCWPYQGYYATGATPYGPFEYKGELNRSPPGAQDHHSIVEYHDQWYYFYHVGNFEGGSLFRRNICIDSLFYNEDGTMQEVRQTTTGVGSDLIGSEPGHLVPGMFEAEEYFRSQGVATVTDGDTVILVDQIDHGDWFDYVLNILGSETYVARIRVADLVAGTRIILKVDEIAKDTLMITGDTSLISIPLFLYQGKHTLKLMFEHPDQGLELAKVDRIELKGNIEYFAVETLVEGGGSVHPEGITYFASGDSGTFTLEADFNNIPDSVWIDGVLQALSSSYTFNNISENHTLRASFSACLPLVSTAYYQVNQGIPVEGTGVVITEGNSLRMWVDHDSTSLLTWTGPNGFSSTDSMVLMEEITVRQQGTYTARLVNPQGCVTDQEFNVQVDFVELDVYEAELFVDQSGIRLESCSDLGGGKYVTEIEDGDRCYYTLSIDRSGYYWIVARVASGSEGGTIQVSERDSLIALIPVEGSLSEGWEDWVTTVPVEAGLEEGFHLLEFEFLGGEGALYNFNWFNLEFSREFTPDTTTGTGPILLTYPNPFVSSTRIAYTLEEASVVNLRIYNSIGQLVHTLVAGEVLPAGSYHHTWNTSDSARGILKSGIYVVRLQRNQEVFNTKVMLLSGD